VAARCRSRLRRVPSWRSSRRREFEPRGRIRRGHRRRTRRWRCRRREPTGECGSTYRRREQGGVANVDMESADAWSVKSTAGAVTHTYRPDTRAHILSPFRRPLQSGRRSFLPDSVPIRARRRPNARFRGAPMIEEIRQKLEDEIMNLTHELTVDLPARIKVAMEHGDLRENAEFKAAKERQGFVEARLNHLTSRMTELSKIDPNEMAYDGRGLHVHDHGRRLHRPRRGAGVARVSDRAGPSRREVGRRGDGLAPDGRTAVQDPRALDPPSADGGGRQLRVGR